MYEYIDRNDSTANSLSLALPTYHTVGCPLCVYFSPECRKTQKLGNSTQAPAKLPHLPLSLRSSSHTLLHSPSIRITQG